jgi:hypothetical protein
MCEVSRESLFRICDKVQLVPIFYFMIWAYLACYVYPKNRLKIQHSLADR